MNNTINLDTYTQNFLAFIVAYWIVILIIGILIAVGVGKYAETRGRDFWPFFWLTFPLGWAIPVLILASVTPHRPARYVLEGTVRFCPQCDEEISAKAKLCRYCRTELAQTGVDTERLGDSKVLPAQERKDVAHWDEFEKAESENSVPTKVTKWLPIAVIGVIVLAVVLIFFL